MFPHTYFPPGYFPPGYFPAGVGTPAVEGGAYFPPTYFPPGYFPASFYPSAGAGTGSPTVDIRSAVYRSLVNDAAVVAVVGARVYPAFLPQSGKHPCVVFHVISDVRVRGLSGTLGVAEARVQLDLRAYRLSDAVALKEALRGKWEGFRGTMQGLEVLGVLPVSEHDFARDPQDASDDRPVVIEVDYLFKYRQSLVTPTG